MAPATAVGHHRPHAIRRTMPNLLRAPSIAVWLLAASCGGGVQPVLQDAQGKYRVVQQAETWDATEANRAATSALSTHRELAAIYAQADATARGAEAACHAAGRGAVRIVSGADLPTIGAQRVDEGTRAASCEYPTGAAAALDLALLACSGVSVPAELAVGTRYRDKSNQGQGGTVVPSPGDFVLALLRTQHATVLATRPTTDVVFRIAVVDGAGNDEWCMQLRDDLKAAAAGHPQVHLEIADAHGEVEQQRLVRDLVDENINAILVASRPRGALDEICAAALAKGIKVVVLGPEPPSKAYTSWVHADEHALGRAAGECMRRLLPGGGAILEIRGPAADAIAQERHRGFAEALGLRKTP